MEQIELPGFEPPPTPNQQHPDGGFLPTWITEQLDENKRGGYSRPCRFHRCHKCFAIVMTGLDADIAAITTTVDPTPITLQIEHAMTTIGRPTYEATKTSPSYRIYPRDLGQTQLSFNGTIVPEHQCGRRLPGFLIPPVVPADHEGLPF